VFTGIIVQARKNSKRFPGKILKKIYNKFRIIDFLLTRIRKTKGIDYFILAVPTKDKKTFHNIAKKNDFIIETGPENNVLKRFYKIAKKYKLNTIIRCTSDSPLMDWTILEKALKIFNKKKIDYLNNIIKPSYPLGIHVEIFNFNSLLKAFKFSKKNAYKEHVTPYIYLNKNKFKIYNLLNKKNLSHYRFSIDYPSDLVYLKNLIKKSKEGTGVSYQKIIKTIKNNSSIQNKNFNFINRFSIT
jgi:spore coat polysaccharide biosynthesis protein SpsF (cytidylyltransferase family)